MLNRALLGSVLLLASLAPTPAAQSNTVPGLDVSLSDLASVMYWGRTGTFPDGVNALSIETQVCNTGSVPVSWEQAMSPFHPFIAVMFVAAQNGRLVQISDRSYVKHGINAQNFDCPACQNPPGPAGDNLGVGCLDTYTVSTNGDAFWLGPPEEVDPWLGTWNPVCSHFDRGEPAVPAPGDCDGVRSLTRAQVTALGVMGHRVHIKDSDLSAPEGTLYYQGQYVIAGAAEALRDDDLASRGLFSAWDGSTWTVGAVGAVAPGSVLRRWGGATLTSGTNGADDGRLYVAVRVTGPVGGLYHYEYAVQNRDNARGAASFRLPICPTARVLAAGFRDIDDDAGNDWAVAVQGGEVAWSTTGNPLEWNTLYNFWFDSDAAPTTGAATFDAAAPGPGAASFTVATTVPGALWNAYAGPGCGVSASPSLYATGAPPQATLGNAGFGLASDGNVPGQPHLLFYSLAAGSFPFSGCTVWMGAAPIQTSVATTDLAGRASHAVPIPNDPGLEGTLVHAQCAGFAAGGPVLGFLELSDGLTVRIGSALSTCP